MSKESKDALISLGVLLMFLFFIGGMFASLDAIVVGKSLTEVIYGSP